MDCSEKTYMKVYATELHMTTDCAVAPTTLLQVIIRPLAEESANVTTILVQRAHHEPGITYSQIMVAITNHKCVNDKEQTIHLYHQQSCVLPNQSVPLQINTCFDETHMCLLQGPSETILYEFDVRKHEHMAYELDIDPEILTSKHNLWNEMWYEICSPRMLQLVPGMSK